MHSKLQRLPRIPFLLSYIIVLPGLCEVFEMGSNLPCKEALSVPGKKSEEQASGLTQQTTSQMLQTRIGWSFIITIQCLIELMDIPSPLKADELQVLRSQYEKEGEYVGVQTKFNYAWVSSHLDHIFFYDTAL